MKCLICGMDISNRQKLAQHLNCSHNTNTSEYKLKYKPDKDNNLLECPLCGKYNMKQLTQHLTSKHHMTKDEFLQQFPNSKLWIDEISERCSKAQQLGIATYKHNLEINPHYYDDVYKKRNSKRNYEEISNKIKQTRIERGTNEKMSKRVKQMWQNEDYQKFQSMKAIEQHKQGLTKIILQKSGKKRYSVTLNNITYKMRSTWEIKVAESLSSRNIKFEYEPFAIKYEFNGTTKQYYPDFYLTDYNLIIEVKPSNLCKNDRVIAKKTACEQCGYRFMFITENELNNLSNISYR